MALTVTYTVQKQDYSPRHGYDNVVLLSFGTGAETYATGISLSGSDLGLPAGVIEDIKPDPVTSVGHVARYDKANGILKLYEGDYANAGEGPLLELDSGDTPAASTLVLRVKGY